jgi:hypothetical protein
VQHLTHLVNVFGTYTAVITIGLGGVYSDIDTQVLKPIPRWWTEAGFGACDSYFSFSTSSVMREPFFDRPNFSSYEAPSLIVGLEHDALLDSDDWSKVSVFAFCVSLDMLFLH